MSAPNTGIAALPAKWRDDARQARDAADFSLAAGREDCADELEATFNGAAQGDGVGNVWACPKCATVNPTFDPWCAQCGEPQPATPAGGGDDLIERLQRSLHDLGEHRLTHVVWRDWLLKDPANESVNPHCGSAEFHDTVTRDYDRHLANIGDAISRLESTNPVAAGGGDDLSHLGEFEAWAGRVIRLLEGKDTSKQDCVDAANLIRRLASAPAGVGDEAYLRWRLKEIMPLFQEARDALPAISTTRARLHGVRLDLADRMDAAGTRKRSDFAAAPTQEPQS